MRHNAEPQETVNADMIVLARKSRGLTQEDLSSEVGCEQGTISKLESGTLQPSDDLLSALSGALKYPVSFFHQKWHIHSYGIQYNRVRKRLNKSTKEKIEAIHNLTGFHINCLLTETVFDVHVPSLTSEILGTPENVARAVRHIWEIPRGPVANVTTEMENAGIVVIHVDFETDKWDGAYMKFPKLPPVVFINDQMTGDRMRFTKAHELGHLVMHQIPKDEKEMDKEADRFAAEFLMPEDDIAPHLGDVDFYKLATLKKKWKVSMGSLLMRAKHLNQINDRRYRYLWSKMSAAGWKKREPSELDILVEEPTLIKELIDVHLSDLGYTVSSLEGLLHFYPDELLNKHYRDFPKARMLRMC